MQELARRLQRGRRPAPRSPRAGSDSTQRSASRPRAGRAQPTVGAYVSPDNAWIRPECSQSLPVSHAGAARSAGRLRGLRRCVASTARLSSDKSRQVRGPSSRWREPSVRRINAAAMCADSLHTSPNRSSIIRYKRAGLAGQWVRVPPRSSGSLDQAELPDFSRKAANREGKARPGLPGFLVERPPRHRRDNHPHGPRATSRLRSVARTCGSSLRSGTAHWAATCSAKPTSSPAHSKPSCPRSSASTAARPHPQRSSRP